MGHEVLGTVIKAGSGAAEAPIGASRLVHPWIGCMEYSECQHGRENHCVKAQSVGVFRLGGYAEYMLVPHPKFLVNADGIDPAVATPYACSGVTVYSAPKKALPVGDDEWLVIMGCGGRGLGAVTIAKALGVKNIVSCDIDDAKLQAARDSGAAATVNLKAAAAQRHRRGPRAVVDTVGAETTSPSASPRWSRAAVMVSLVCSAESSGCRYRRCRCGQFQSSAPIPAIWRS